MSARHRFAQIVKRIVATGLYYSGLLTIWQGIVLRRRAVVLMYHRVLTEEERAQSGSHQALTVELKTFARQMALLKRRFNVLSLEQFARCLEDGVPFPDSSCLITFDDGWRDNVSNALPVLRRHTLPALIFLPMNYIGTMRVFWQEALTHLLERLVQQVRQQPERREAFREILEPAGLQAVLQIAAPHPRSLIVAQLAALKRANVSRLRALPEVLARELGVSLEELSRIDGFVDWREVREMAAHGVAFGAHGAEHLLLTEVPIAEAEFDIQASKRELEARVNHSIPTFSYPNGYYTPEIIEAVRKCGYRLAFVTRRGFVSSADDRFTIARLNVHESVTSTAPLFLARVLGLL